MNNFSTNFVKLREERGLSIKQVASFTGATTKDVKKWESGTSLPTDTKIIAALEGLLGKEISQTLESNDFKPIKTSEKIIEDSLFTIGSHLACDPSKNKMKLPEIKSSDINRLENWIDAMDNKLEPLQSFTLPGGSVSSAHCHVARCICRRAERLIVDLHENENGVNVLIMPYLNRLSDYLFTLSRKLTVDDGAEELKWQPKQ